MELLVLVVLTAFLTGLRDGGRSRPLRPLPLVVVSALVAAAYLGQRVI